MPKNRVFRSDILVIGCGIAGASAALEAAKRGLRVNIITKAAIPEESNTYYAQGGIVSMGEDDNARILKEDIIKTGDGINNPESVEVLAGQGRELVERILIEELRIPFTRSSGEALDYAQEAGHSRRRILHVKDSTGRTIEEAF
ncbi:MAG: FAD-dependent oxidoreductase, partial [Candidatus Aminicenantales bacterium]